MSAAGITFSPALPWSIDPRESVRFRRIVGGALILFLLLSTLLAVVKPPPVERAEAEKLPPRLARVLVEQKAPLPKPEPVVVEPVVKKELEQKPEVVPPEAAKEVVTSAPESRARAPKSETADARQPTAEEQVRGARERAAKTGLLVMRDQLAALRDIGSESLSQNQVSVGLEGTERRAERDLITKKATAGSGGVATKGVAYGGGGSLAARETTKVAGARGGAPSLAAVQEEERASKRTDEEIKLAFDANKSAIYGIYRRALRENPLLEGRVLLKLTIEPSGQVTACNIVSSTLKAPALEEKIIARIQLINFGARPKVETWSGTYHIDFVPST